jgi:hypothetical protein
VTVIPVIPAKAGTQMLVGDWIPAFAGTNGEISARRSAAPRNDGYIAANQAASAEMSCGVSDFIRSVMPGLLPRAPLWNSVMVFSR